MWSRLKRLCTRRPAQPPASRVRVDDAGIWRDAGAAGVTEFWPWANVREFGFRLLQAGFPDPWSGDYLEGSWFIRVPSDGGGLMAVDFDADALDPTICRRRCCAACPAWTWPRCARAWRRRGARPGMGCARANGWPGAATPRTPRPDTAPARRPPTRELGAIQPLLQVREDIVGRLQSHRQTQQSF